MRSLLGASLVLALAACSLTETVVEPLGGPGSDGGSNADAGQKPTVPGTHFHAAEGAWAVPLGGFAGAGFNSVTSGNWATMDIDGDHKPDLVLPSDPLDSGSKVWGFGQTPYWKIHRSGSSGFAVETAWTVPSGGFVSTGFNSVASGKWTTMDIDGDGKPDLVLPSDPLDPAAKVWGQGASPSWKVYKNTGSGFAAESRWSVPLGGFATTGFNNVSSSRWSTVDLDGDGRPDLVVPSEPTDSTAKVWSHGERPYWKFYKNTGEGFAEEARWNIPMGGFASTGYNSVASSRWATLDLDGDGKPELVVPTEPGDAGAEVWGLGGAPFWKVYKNTGEGFGDEVKWPVPAGGVPGSGFNHVVSGKWTTLDLDSDGRPDLVVPSDPADTSSRVWGFGDAPFWKIYRNTGAGFGPESRWSVPDGGFVGTGFHDVASGRWSTLDLDGDGRLDLVVPTDPGDSGGKVWGHGRAPFWKLYRGAP
ncbi:MAG: VCBS repeat-containing protein [Myxococcales bacterium]|nr:VCBS repeat-containing protein [Myxococcales bacterium]